MKVFLMVAVLLLCSAVPSFAVCDAEIDTSGFDELIDTLELSFPFSVVFFAIDMLEQISSIQPVSPTDVSYHIWDGVEITPLSWMEVEGVDAFFAVLRIIFMGIMLLSIARHVIERIL